MSDVIGKDDFKVDLNKYGIFFWFVLFGFVDIIVSIIYKPEYVAFGFYFSIFGILSYITMDVLDRYTKNKEHYFLKNQTEKEIEKKVQYHAPFLFYCLVFFIRLVLFFLLMYFINRKYCLL